MASTFTRNDERTQIVLSRKMNVFGWAVDSDDVEKRFEELVTRRNLEFPVGFRFMTTDDESKHRRYETIMEKKDRVKKEMDERKGGKGGKDKGRGRGKQQW